ncbi:unnamed protein product [Trichobilharzia regenti]|nr:unnamed protein product [Trichobilharzia regenti]
MSEPTHQEPIVKQIGRNKWRWIGHTLRKPSSDIPRQAIARVEPEREAASLVSRSSNQINKFSSSKSDNYNHSHHHQHQNEGILNSRNSLQEFLQLELHNALQLVQAVHSNLASLSRACRGSQLVTDVLHQLAGSILHGETPETWLSHWPEGPTEVVPFLKDLVTKSNTVQVGCSF